MPRARLAAALLYLLLALPLGIGRPARAAAAPPTAESVPNQLIIAFRADADERARDAAIARRGGRTLRRLDGIGARVVTLPPGRVLSLEAGIYAADRAVRYAEPNVLYRALDLPNDPLFAQQWGLRNTGQSNADIHATGAWASTQGDRGIVVGVVDTGVDYDHPDLAANIWSKPAGLTLPGYACPAASHGYRAVAGVASCDPLDDNGHGTHIAGTIGAVGDNGVGVSGVNWRVGIMALKFLDQSGAGAVSDAVVVLDYAITARQAGVNLRALNASWGGAAADSQALRDTIARANDAGILVIAAAGNAGQDNGAPATPFYPANYGASPASLPNVIAVAATNQIDIRPSFSNYGGTTVHLGAPGADITSTYCAWDATTRACAHTYALSSGTSMAAAHVTGAAALILAAPRLGGLDAATLKGRLLECGDPLTTLRDSTITGRRLNVERAIAGSGCGPSYRLAVTAAPATGGALSPTAPGPYGSGATIALTATAAPGYDFAGWTVDGVAAGTANPFSLAMTADRNVVANFAPAGPAPAAGLQYYPLARPIRLLDTRPNFGACEAPGTPLTVGAPYTLIARRSCADLTIPAGALAVVGNATAVADVPGAGAGHVTLWPSGQPAPRTSTLNYVPGAIRPNAFTIGLGSDGAFMLAASGPVDLVVDLVGYYAPPGVGGRYYHPLPAPVRLLDTRKGAAGCDTPDTPLASGAVRAQSSRPLCTGVATSATALAGNATVVADVPGAAPGYVSLWPAGLPRPNVSTLNYAPGTVAPNAFTVALDRDGQFAIGASSGVNLIIDIVGYFSDSASDAAGPGLLYYPLAAPARLLDTRPGFPACVAPGTPLPAGVSPGPTAIGACDGTTVPATARALLGNATVVATVPGAAGGFVAFWSAGQPQPNASTLNYVPGQIAPNACLIGLGAGGAFLIGAHTSVHLILDLTGYYAP